MRDGYLATATRHFLTLTQMLIKIVQMHSLSDTKLKINDIEPVEYKVKIPWYTIEYVIISIYYGIKS